VGPLIMQLADNRGRWLSGCVRNGYRHGAPDRGQVADNGAWAALRLYLYGHDFNNLYHAEQQTGQVFITFAIFAILIACLGLFGLVTYARSSG